MADPRRIDVHHHIIPPAFVQAMQRRGLNEVAGAPLPRYSPEQSLQVMDANGIRTALVSLSAPGVHFGERAEACDLARACNEYAAQMRQAHPGRFGYFAVLPMPDTDAACVEAIHALDHMGANGVVLLGSTDGYFLGDPRFDELMAELDRRKAVVFVHPNLHATSTQLGLGAPGFLIEFLCDTTRAALNLVLSGTMERFPGIRFILAHSGGFLPYVAWRASLANMMRPYDTQAPQGVLHYIRRFYFDTALSPSDYSLAALRQLVPPSQILFGSDFPFAPAPLTALQCQTLERSGLLDTEAHAAIDRRSALSLFPELAEAGDSVATVTNHRHENTRQRLQRAARAPLIALIESVRKR